MLKPVKTIDISKETAHVSVLPQYICRETLHVVAFNTSKLRKFLRVIQSHWRKVTRKVIKDLERRNREAHDTVKVAKNCLRVLRTRS